MIKYFIIFLSCIVAIVYSNSLYCMPYTPNGTPTSCWPKSEKWETLRKNLTGKLNFIRSSDYSECFLQGDDAFKIEKAANGICMQYHDCSKAFCNKTQPWNLPEYSVEVQTLDDIKHTVNFARENNIAVTVKTSGHSYAGSSTGYGTLLIWMHKFEKAGQIMKFKDSCNTPNVHDHVLKIGGGQVWKEAYDAVGSKYHIVGGGGLTVSAAGGWLMGGGLSALSRNLGIGIDNVLRFDVVLANGEHVSADKCSNIDLFWALRGGGGGTFGVITAAYHKLHPVSNIIYSYLSVNDIAVWPHPAQTTDSFLDFWVEKSPFLDKRWGGYWTLSTYILYFQGNQHDADTTFLNDVRKWISSLPEEKRGAISFESSSHNSYYDQRGGRFATTDKTGQKEFNIANRLIPRSFVVDDPTAAKNMLKWMVRNGFYTFSYLLGGVMQDVKAGDTAINPAMRKAIWQIETFDDRLIKMLRREVNHTGVGYNHAAKNEPDWENAFWGSNLARLTTLKRIYDPWSLFNCWHCVGYQETPLKGSSSSATTVSLVVLFICMIVNHLII